LPPGTSIQSRPEHLSPPSGIPVSTFESDPSEQTPNWHTWQYVEKMRSANWGSVRSFGHGGRSCTRAKAWLQSDFEDARFRRKALNDFVVCARDKRSLGWRYFRNRVRCQLSMLCKMALRAHELRGLHRVGDHAAGSPVLDALELRSEEA
jgi:hypothetical protein